MWGPAFAQDWLILGAIMQVTNEILSIHCKNQMVKQEKRNGCFAPCLQIVLSCAVLVAIAMHVWAKGRSGHYKLAALWRQPQEVQTNQYLKELCLTSWTCANCTTYGTNSPTNPTKWVSPVKAAGGGGGGGEATLNLMIIETLAWLVGTLLFMWPCNHESSPSLISSSLLPLTLPFLCITFPLPPLSLQLYWVRWYLWGHLLCVPWGQF